MELSAKRLEILCEIDTKRNSRGGPRESGDATNAEVTVRDVQTAASNIGLQIDVFNASTAHEIDAAFAGFERAWPNAVFVGPHPIFLSLCVYLSTGDAPWDRRILFVA